MFDTITLRSCPTYPFVGRATLPLERGQWFPSTTTPNPSLRIEKIKPDGTRTLRPSQWEAVTRYDDGSAAVAEVIFPDWGSIESERSYAVDHNATPPSAGSARLPFEAVADVLTVGRVGVVVQYADQKQGFLSLSAPLAAWLIDKRGPFEWQAWRYVKPPVRGEFGALVFVSVDVFSGASHWVVNLTAPGDSSDIYFHSIVAVQAFNRGILRDWDEPDTPRGPGGMLVASGDHVWPQGFEREWRFSIYDPTLGPRRTHWGTASGWNHPGRAGFLAQGCAMPFGDDECRRKIALLAAQEYDAVAYRRPNEGATAIENFGPWVYAGVKYGGMTGGIGVEQWAGALTLAAGLEEGIAMHKIRAMRYACRQQGGMYNRETGDIEVARDYLGKGIWKHYAYAYGLKRPGTDPQSSPQDTEWDDVLAWDEARRPALHAGSCPYEASMMDKYTGLAPIDYQHTIRATKDAKALVYLANDALSKLRLVALAENARWTYYLDAGGEIARPIPSAGRGEAWVLDLATHAWAVGTNEFRREWQPWFDAFGRALTRAQYPSGVFQHINFGKQAIGASAEPNSHMVGEECPIGLHAIVPNSTTYVGDFEVGRANEHVFLCHALRAALQGPLIGAPAIRDAYLLALREGLRFIWKPSTAGPHARFIADSWFKTWDDVRRFLVESRLALGDDQLDAEKFAEAYLSHPNLAPDTQHVASTIAYAFLEGIDASSQAKWYSGQMTLSAFEDWLSARGLVEKIDSRAPLHAVARRFF